jgi:hypothetical protein
MIQGANSETSTKLNPMKDTVNKSPSNTEFSFKYTESGGLANRYLFISYDSKTNLIKSSTDVSGATINQKQLSESHRQKLIEMITASGFFETKTDYPPQKEDENLVTCTLTITVDNSVHTTGWTDTSVDTPDNLSKIVHEIKIIASKEKIL